MLDRASIAAASEEAGRKARARRAGPKALVKWPGEELGASIPHLGTACADLDEIYERVATLFVDSSGFGRPGEPALTMKQFFARLDELHEEHGGLQLATEDAGQFQVYVAVWKEKAREEEAVAGAEC